MPTHIQIVYVHIIYKTQLNKYPSLYEIIHTPMCINMLHAKAKEKKTWKEARTETRFVCRAMWTLSLTR